MTIAYHLSNFLWPSLNRVKLEEQSFIMNRKHFLLQSATASAAVLISPFQSIAKTLEDPQPYKTEVVKEFVIAGHGKLDRVKELLEKIPVVFTG